MLNCMYPMTNVRFQAQTTVKCDEVIFTETEHGWLIWFMHDGIFAQCIWGQK